MRKEQEDENKEIKIEYKTDNDDKKIVKLCFKCFKSQTIIGNFRPMALTQFVNMYTYSMKRIKLRAEMSEIQRIKINKKKTRKSNATIYLCKMIS